MIATILTSGMLILAQADAPSGRDGALDALSWLCGCWTGEGLGGTVSECWTQAASGEMIGAFQYSRGGELQFSELLMIGEAGGAFGYHVKHFNRDLTGWEARDEQVSFNFISADAATATFSGLELIRNGEDGFTVLLQMETSEGEANTAEFVYRRAE